MDSFKQNIINAIGLMKKIQSGMSTDTASDVLGFLPGDAELINLILKWTTPVALALMIIFFSVGLIEQATRNGHEFDVHSFIKAGMILVIADILLAVTPYILTQLIDFSSTMLTEANAVVDAAPGAIAVENDELKSYNLISLIILAVGQVFAMVIGLIPIAIIMILCYSAKLEIILRVGFAPIGFSGFASDNGRQGAIRYAKKLLACMLYAGAIVIALTIANRMTLGTAYGGEGTTSLGAKFMGAAATDGTISDAFTKLVQHLVEVIFGICQPIIAIGAVNIAKSAINEAVGV